MIKKKERKIENIYSHLKIRYKISTQLVVIKEKNEEQEEQSINTSMNQ